MKYNIYFELAAAALLVVLNLYVYLQYPSDSPSNRHFKRLAGVLFLAVTLDVVTAITISYADSVPIWLNTALNTIYLISDVFLECQFVIYCTCAIYGTAIFRSSRSAQRGRWSYCSPSTSSPGGYSHLMRRDTFTVRFTF